MYKNTCFAIVVTCIDFRFQEYIERWLESNFKPKTYDRVALGGGIYDSYSVLKQVEISKNLHDIQKAILINHEDCGAYGKEGTYERHVADLKDTAKKIEKLFNKIGVDTYYLHLDGTFEKIV